jgi:hypothetical protein
MNHDISKPVPQGSDGAQDAENSRITAIANQLERLCTVHEAQLGDSQADVSRFEAEQRAAEQMAKSNGYWIPVIIPTTPTKYGTLFLAMSSLMPKETSLWLMLRSS